MFIGTAGWSIPARHADAFPARGTHLERYAARLKAVEINSSFYRPHQRKTYARWAAGVPEDFRFAVELPRSITQDRRLRNSDDLLMRFADEVAGLDHKLGVVLVQLPPSLAYDEDIAMAFFHDIRRHLDAAIACEPRHISWFTPQADAMLNAARVARVAADPPRAPTDGIPGGWRGFAYYRWHGSPRIYHSDYPQTALEQLAATMRRNDWCIFDNTAAFAALGNALMLKDLAG